MSISDRLRRRRGRVSLLLAALTALIAFAAGPARAVPPRCEDGSPPPCEGEDPPPDRDPDPEPTPRPTLAPTTVPPRATVPIPPPTTVPPPPPVPPTWKVSVLSLVEDDAGLNGPVSAARYWMQEPVADPGNFFTWPPPDITIWGLTPAGEATLDNGQLAFPDMALPSGAEMVLQIRESGSSGLLCRTVPRSALPLSGTPLHLLVPDPTTTTAAELQAMLADFVGPVTEGLPAGVTMDITAANLTPQSDGLMLQLLGNLDVSGFKFTYDYHLLLTLAPATGTELQYVAWVQAVGPGTVELTSVGTPNGDGIKDQVKAVLLPKLRSAVPGRASTAVNNAIHGAHEVQWWRDQGFHVSLRRVTYSTAGLTLYPSLCRFG